MSLIICDSDNPNLIKECGISRNYAKFLVSESIFAAEQDFTFLSCLYAEKPVFQAWNQSCISQIDLVNLIICIRKVPSGLFCCGLMVCHEQIGCTEIACELIACIIERYETVSLKFFSFSFLGHKPVGTSAADHVQCICPACVYLLCNPGSIYLYGSVIQCCSVQCEPERIRSAYASLDNPVGCEI